jgi:hypothetical protein
MNNTRKLLVVVAHILEFYITHEQEKLFDRISLGVQPRE